MKISTEKPILDVIRRMREEAEFDREGASPDDPFVGFASTLEKYADEFEAEFDSMTTAFNIARQEAFASTLRAREAERKEKAAFSEGVRSVTKQTPGNAAALREALEQCGRALEKAQCSSAFQAANTGASYITAALSSAHAALAAPARNCDRPECADVESAWATYCAETNRADCKGFARWLFAKAEGGDHA